MDAVGRGEAIACAVVLLGTSRVTPPIRLRFAPSPTGLLHVGNARTALFNWLLARGQGGTCPRVEDTDVVRIDARFEDGIKDDLRWLGLQWDEGPDVGGPYPPYRQSERMDRYRAAAERLITGGHAYYCFCGAEQLEQERGCACGRASPAVFGALSNDRGGRSRRQARRR